MTTFSWPIRDCHQADKAVWGGWFYGWYKGRSMRWGDLFRFEEKWIKPID